MKYTNSIKGAQFNGKRAFFRPTTMSLAMAKAGLIPAAHLTKEVANTAVVRNRNDNFNQRPSVKVAF